MKFAVVGLLSLVRGSDAANGAAGYVVKNGDFNDNHGDIRQIGGTDVTTGIEACNHDPTCSLVVFTGGTTFLKRLEDSGRYWPNAGGVSYLKSPHGGGTADHWGGLLGDFNDDHGDISGAFGNSDPYSSQNRCDHESGCDLSVIRGGTTWNKNLQNSGPFHPDPASVSWIRSDQTSLRVMFEQHEMFHGKQWSDQVQVLVALPKEERQVMMSNALKHPDVQHVLSIPSPAMAMATIPKTEQFSSFSFLSGLVAASAAFGVYTTVMKRQTKQEVALLADA